MNDRRRDSLGGLNSGQLIAIGVASLSIFPTAALAQQSASAGTNDEIIVTAQRREQNLIDVPIAVTALQGQFLQDRSITTIDNLSALAPGLLVSSTATQPNNAQLSIRGSVQQNGSITLDPSVGLYLDGVYIGKAQGSIFDINDLERVEVLRGPQGTLYGRNTLAGAISFVTRKPDGQFRASAETSVGNYDAYTVRGLVNIPLSDHLFVKLSGMTLKRDGNVRLVPDPASVGGYPLGFLYNNSVVSHPQGGGAQSGQAGTRDRQSLLAQVRYAPSADLTVDYSYDYSRTRGRADASQLDSVDPDGFLGANCSLGPAVCIPAYLYVQPKYSKTLSSDYTHLDRIEINGHGLTVTWNTDAVTLKSITGYRKMNYDGAVIELDGTPLWLASGGLDTKYKSFSQEFQATGKIGDKLNYVAGLYYFWDKGFTRSPQSFFFGSVNYDTSWGGTTKAYAIYGQADYNITDQIVLTAGLRYTKERKTIVRSSILLPNTVLVDVRKSDDVSKDFSALNPTVVLAYKPNDRLSAYIKFAQGYRSGGFNGEATSNIATTTPFRPETINSFEAGLKMTWWDKRINLNLAAFHNHHRNMQLSVFTATSSLASLLQNAGSANMNGVEVEMSVRPTPALRISGNFAYLDASYSSYRDTNALGAVVDVSENRTIPHAPKYQAALNVDLRAFEGSGGDNLHLIFDARHTSSYFLYAYAKTPTADFPLVPPSSSAKAQSLTLLDLQLRYEDIALGKAKAWIGAWTRNLTNTHRKVNGINFGAQFGGLNIANYNEPRTYGVSAGIQW